MKNVGSIDKIARVVAGIALLCLLVFGQGGVRYVGLLGFVMLGTAAFGYCPLYSLFKLNTCDRK